MYAGPKIMRHGGGIEMKQIKDKLKKHPKKVDDSWAGWKIVDGLRTPITAVLHRIITAAETVQTEKEDETDKRPA